LPDLGQGVAVSEAPTYEQLLALVGQLTARVAELEAVARQNEELKCVLAVQADRIAELERRLGADSSNSSRAPVLGSAVGQ
jgi:hypothetical protein